MTGGQFTRNAGKYVCINPDNDPATDVCPSIWPGFEGEVGVGGAINYTLGDACRHRHWNGDRLLWRDRLRPVCSGSYTTVSQ